jgi:hypothetical protein
MIMVSPKATYFDHFRRLRPQTRFGAQPAKPALGAEINTSILHYELCIQKRTLLICCEN